MSEKSSPSTAWKLSCRSTPSPSISPMLTTWRLMKPPEGGNCFETSRSFTVRRQYVAFTASRSLNRPASMPPSISVLSSGFSVSLPRLSGATPGPVTLGSDSKVRKRSKSPGCSPDSPYAPRTRRVEKVSLSHPSASLITTEKLAFG